MKTTPKIIIDTREQLPYKFHPGDRRVRKKLDTGDYSLVGYEDRIAVERKSFGDFVGCCGGQRRRFMECVDRLLAIPRRMLVLEAQWHELDHGHTFGKVPPEVIVSTIVSLISRGLPVFIVKDRKHGMETTRKFLFTAWRHETNEDQR